MATEAQIAANRRNAQKSTGPRSQSGKERSRRNSLKHGLRADRLVVEADHETVRSTIDVYYEEILPESQVEKDMTRRAATSSARLKKCEDIEQTTAADTVEKAVHDWYDRRQQWARTIGRGLEERPAETVERLEESAFGCDWLLRHWRRQQRRLNEGRRCWTLPDLNQALAMLGLEPARSVAEGEPIARLLYRLARNVAPAFLEPPPPCPDDDPVETEPEAARKRLLEFVAEEIDRLETVRDERWLDRDEPERKSVAQKARVDSTPKGQLVQRYERAAELSLHRSLNMIVKIRDRRNREDYKAIREMTPKTSVGGGWWKEDGAAPSPPGFAPSGEPNPFLTRSWPPDPHPTDPVEPPRDPATNEPGSPRGSAREETHIARNDGFLSAEHEPFCARSLAGVPTGAPNPFLQHQSASNQTPESEAPNEPNSDHGSIKEESEKSSDEQNLGETSEPIDAPAFERAEADRRVGANANTGADASELVAGWPEPDSDSGSDSNAEPALGVASAAIPKPAARSTTTMPNEPNSGDVDSCPQERISRNEDDFERRSEVSGFGGGARVGVGPEGGRRFPPRPTRIFAFGSRASPDPGPLAF